MATVEWSWKKGWWYLYKKEME